MQSKSSARGLYTLSAQLHYSVLHAHCLFGKHEYALSKGGLHTWMNIESHLKEHEFCKGTCY